MSVFRNYVANKNQGMPPVAGAMDDTALFNPSRFWSLTPDVQTQQEEQQQVDNSKAIASLAKLLGPTPAEREAQEAQAQKHKQQMQMWAGLFDGLRQLGNLYYTSKGATPQRLNSPYELIEQQTANDSQRRAANDSYARNYAQTYQRLMHGINDDARKAKVAEAQARWFDTRGEMARLKAKNDKLRAAAQVRATDARAEYIKARTQQMNELHPLQKQKLQAIIKKLQHDANKPYSASSGSGSKKGEDQFKILAEYMESDPDIVGPILEQEGLGTYDWNSRQFSFEKNPTRGIATVVNTRTRVQKATKGSSGGRTIAGYKKGGAQSGGKTGKGKAY